MSINVIMYIFSPGESIVEKIRQMLSVVSAVRFCALNFTQSGQALFGDPLKIRMSLFWLDVQFSKLKAEAEAARNSSLLDTRSETRFTFTICNTMVTRFILIRDPIATAVRLATPKMTISKVMFHLGGNCYCCELMTTKYVPQHL